MSSEDKVKEAGAVKPGAQSSEFKLLKWGVGLSMLVTVIPIVLKAVPPGGVVWVIVSCLGACAAILSTYISSRGKVKSGASIAKGLALGGAKPPDPPQG